MKILKAFGLVIGLALLLLVGAVAIPVAAQNVVCYQAQGGASWVASSGCTWNVQSGATLQLDSGSTFTNAGYDQLTAQTAITVTDGGVITPTGAYQPLTAAGSVGSTLGGCSAGNAGKITRFVNTVAQSIIITDTGNTVLASTYTMGQYDTLTTICDGTRQIELARSNN